LNINPKSPIFINQMAIQAAHIKPNIPEQVKELIQSIDPDAEVILFGSRARGDYRQDSDWDFLVLLEVPLSLELKNEIRDRLYELELEVSDILSARIHEKAEWEKLEVTPFYQNVEQDGIAI